MRVLVTGASGFIGSTTVRLLVGRGDTVRCFLRKTSKLDRIGDLPIEVAHGDITDPGSLADACQDCDAVIHLAGIASWEHIHSPRMPAVMVGGTKNVLQAAGTKRRVVYVSSSVAIGGTEEPTVQNEGSPFALEPDRYVYAGTKVAAEELCRQAAASGTHVSIVNPCEVYGPGDTERITCGNLIDFAHSTPVMVCTGGTSVVHVEDVGKGILAALDKGRSGERYILGGENLTVVELARLTLELLERRARVMVVPNALLRAVARVGGALRLPLPFNPAVIPYATLYWFMDNRKAREELGCTFRSAREVLEPTLKWLKETRMIR